MVFFLFLVELTITFVKYSLIADLNINAIIKYKLYLFLLKIPYFDVLK